MMETGWKGNGKREVDRRETEKKGNPITLTD